MVAKVGQGQSKSKDSDSCLTPAIVRNVNVLGQVVGILETKNWNCIDLFANKIGNGRGLMEFWKSMVDKWFVTVGSITRSSIYGRSSEPGGEVGGHGLQQSWFKNGQQWLGENINNEVENDNAGGMRTTTWRMVADKQLKLALNKKKSVINACNSLDLQLETCMEMRMTGIPQGWKLMSWESRGDGSQCHGNHVGMEANVVGIPRGWKPMSWESRGDGS